jgi:NADH dehydrogenase FAD-containing subunit
MTVNKDDTILVKQKDGETKTLSYDILALCSGYYYSEPIKGDTIKVEQDRKKQMQDYYKRIQEANKILVAGGGPAGIEIIGELIHYHPTKQLCVVTKGERLLPHFPVEAAKYAEDYLKKHNVEIHYNVTYTEDYSKDNGYDLTFTCLG